MTMHTQRILVLLFLILAAPLATAQRVKVDSEQRYLLLATKRTGTMEKELNEVADQGFRVLVGSPTSGAEMAIFMERVAAPPKTYKYRLLATTRTGTMNRELNEAAADGWRLLPRTMISKEGAGPFAGIEIIVLLERVPDSDMKYEYKLLATTLTGTLQKEVTESIAAGFTLAGMVSRGEHMVIMERETRR